MTLRHCIQRLLGRRSPYGFTGSYKTWADAVAASHGYDHTVILEKVAAAASKVQRGEAAYERDSIAFTEKAYAWNVLGPLLLIAKEAKASSGGALNVVDFGGSLGSTYMQHRDALSGLNVSWNVVEQPAFVARGREQFETGVLKFFGTVDDALKASMMGAAGGTLSGAKKFIDNSSVFVASSSLQYLEDPYSFMRDIAARGFSYILIDRTPCMKDSERITVQKVPARIYGTELSYPAHIIDETKLMAAITSGAHTCGGSNYERTTDWNEKFGDVTLRGWLLKKKS